MKYMLLIETDRAAWNELTRTERDEAGAGRAAFVAAVAGSGEMVGGESLTDPSHGALVRVRDEKRQVTVAAESADEAERFFSAYYIVDVESAERAVELAAMIPEARFGAIEVRPIMTLGGAEM